MMKKLLLIVVVLMVTPLFTASVLAQATTGPRLDTALSTTSTPQAAKKVSQPKPRQYTGTIILADKTAKGIVVRGRKGEMTFDVSSAHWQPYKSMNEVRLGDAVTVNYREKDGEMIASSVTKANPSGVKEEYPAGTEKKSGRNSTSTAAKGGMKEESTSATK